MTQAVTNQSPGVTPPEDIARMTNATAQINPYPDIAPPTGAAGSTTGKTSHPSPIGS
jgi:hypothetical protein